MKFDLPRSEPSPNFAKAVLLRSEYNNEMPKVQNNEIRIFLRLTFNTGTAHTYICICMFICICIWTYLELCKVCSVMEMECLHYGKCWYLLYQNMQIRQIKKLFTNCWYCYEEQQKLKTPMLIPISDFLSDLYTSSPTVCSAKATYVSSHLTPQYTVPFTSTNFFLRKNHKLGWFWGKTVLIQIYMKSNCWAKFITYWAFPLVIWTSPLHPSGNFYENCMKLHIFEMFISLHEKLAMRNEQGWGDKNINP